MLEWATAHAPQRYDAVALMVGNWDASYTVRDDAAFERDLEAQIAHLRAAWPETRVVLSTLTPCGATRAGAKAYTPAAACQWVPTINRAVRRIVERHPGAWLLDAHQMAASHPAVNRSGNPPGAGRQPLLRRSALKIYTWRIYTWRLGGVCAKRTHGGGRSPHRSVGRHAVGGLAFRADYGPSRAREGARLEPPERGG